MGSLVLAAVLGARRGSTDLRDIVRPLHTKTLAVLFIVPAFFAAVLCLPLHGYALRGAPGGVTAVLLGTTPLFTLPIVLARGEGAGWRTIAGTLIGFVGVVGVVFTTAA